MKLTNKRIYQTLSVFLGLTLIVSFQNCSQGFQSIGPGQTSNSSVSLGDSSTQTPSPAPSPSVPEQHQTPSPGANCSFNNQTIAHGSSVTAFQSTFVSYGGSCASQKRNCSNGVLSGSFQHASCSVQASPSPSTNPYASIDELLASMPANSWKEIPGTKMEDVCPQPRNGFACLTVVGAWSGGDFDQKRNRMIIYGGGHADSWYNNVYSFDLMAMKWERLSEMPGGGGEQPPAGWNDIRTETCGYYTKGPLILPSGFQLTNSGYVPFEKCFVEPVLSQLDFQQPRSSHTYGQVFVDRIRDRYCEVADGSFYPSAQAGTRVANCFDPNTRQWVRIADMPERIGARGTTALDSAGNMWMVPGEGGNIAKYDPLANSWSSYGYSNYETRSGMDIDRKRNQMIVLHSNYGVPFGTPYVIRRLDLNSPSSLIARQTYTEISTSGDKPVVGAHPRPGFIYADNKDRFYAWQDGRDVYSFNPANNEWTRHLATGDDPGASASNGTYGRFRYVASKGVFVLVNSTKQNVFIYKPEN